MRIGLVAAALALGVLGACGGGSDEGGGAPDGQPAATPTPTASELGTVSSVTEVRDALVDAGYVCSNWDQSNVVDLAAESGSCDDDSVLSTYASAGDLQAQLDSNRDMDKLFEENGVELTPNLVGPNWIVNAPGADKYADALGGTVVSPQN
jgi:hypothetical protein